MTLLPCEAGQQWGILLVSEGNNGFLCPRATMNYCPRAEKPIVAQGHLNKVALFLLL